MQASWSCVFIICFVSVFVRGCEKKRRGPPLCDVSISSGVSGHIFLPHALVPDQPNEVIIDASNRLTRLSIRMQYGSVGAVAETSPLQVLKKTFGFLVERFSYRTTFYLPFIAPPGAEVELSLEAEYRDCGEDNQCPHRTIQQTAKVKISPKWSIILGETDKPIYRPGENVSFRLLALNSRMALADNTSMKWPKNTALNGQLVPISQARREKPPFFDTIFLENSAGQRLRQWNNVSSQVALNLSYTILPDAPLGEWKLYANVLETQEVISFEVRPYTLPLFRVIELGFAHEDYKTVKLCAEYTVGSPVPGSYSIELCHDTRNSFTLWHDSSEQCSQVSGQLDEAGCKTIQREELLPHLSYRGANLTANVTEAGTNFTVSVHSKINTYQFSNETRKPVFSPAEEATVPALHGIRIMKPVVTPKEKIAITLRVPSIKNGSYSPYSDLEGLCLLGLVDTAVGAATNKRANEINKESIARAFKFLSAQRNATLPEKRGKAQHFGFSQDGRTIRKLCPPRTSTSVHLTSYNKKHKRPSLPISDISYPDRTKLLPPNPNIGQFDPLSFPINLLSSKSLLRDFFPEVWRFEVVRLKQTSTQGVDEAKISLTAPDSITTWSLNVACVTRGLGLWTPPPNSPREITVVQPFFIDFRAPTRAKRNETLILPVTLFFLTPKSANLWEDCFEVVVSIDANATEWNIDGPSEFTKCVCGRQARSVLAFKLKALKIGNLNVTARAIGKWGTPLCSKRERNSEDRVISVAQDAMRRSIRVEAEGVERSLVIGKYMCMQSGRRYSFALLMLV